MPAPQNLTPLEDAATEIQSRAHRLMHRENTDFVGRMGEQLCEAEGLCEDGGPAAADLEDYRDAMLELAALAMAQAALASVQQSNGQIPREGASE